MRRRLELVDTSVLVELLQVPGEYDNLAQIVQEFNEKQTNGVSLQLPAATIVESGAHIIRIKDGRIRRECAQRFENVLRATWAREAPWTFTDLVWDRNFVGELLDPPVDYQYLNQSLSTKALEMGDLVILAEFRRIRATVDPSYVEVAIWTQDGKLAAAAEALD